MEVVLERADAIIAALGLQPHPEGGWFRQSWAGAAGPDGRSTGTCIHFLLKAGEASHWHRVDADEVWLWHAGAPLVLRVAADAAGPARSHLLGGDVLSGQAPHVVVPAGHWQAAAGSATAGDGYSLVSCTVSPGFRYEGFELAPAGFDIPGRDEL